MRLHPVNMSKDDLVEILNDMLECVAEGDSFEGSIEYLMSSEEHPFDVRASYRRGNSMGQGSLRLVGEMR